MKNPSVKKTVSAVKSFKRIEDESMKKIKGGNIKGGHKPTSFGVSTKPNS